MRLTYPKTWGALTGWMMNAFVIGITLHSIFFRLRIPSALLIISPVVFIPVVILVLRRPFHSRWKVAGLLLVTLLMGVWRLGVAPRPKLQRIGTRYMVVASSPATTGIRSILPRWRSYLTRRIGAVLPRDEAALLTGILYGERQLSKEQRALFRSAGLMHIVAVSGSNVTIVTQCLSLFLARLRLKRRQLFFLTSGALFIFVGFVGFSASVARAAFMGWLVLLAREVGRPASPFRLLLVAATVLLLVDPWQLGFDIGFALSFLAMWGLLAWTPIFERWLNWLPEKFEIRQIVAMTFSATLMTTPYMAWMFERISLAGIFTNALVLPLLPFVMGWGAIATIGSLAVSGQLLTAPVVGMLKLIEEIAALVEYVPWMEQKTKGVSLSTIIVFYVAMGYFWFLLREESDLSTERPLQRGKKSHFLNNVGSV